MKIINKKSFLTFLKIFTAAASLIFLINYISAKDLFGSLKRAEYFFIAAAFILVFPNLFFQFSRWKLVCRYLLNETDSKKIFLSLFQGFPAGTVTPGRIGEYFARGFALHGKSLPAVATSVFIEKLFPIIPVLFIGLPSYFIFLGLSSYLILLIIFIIILFFTFLIFGRNYFFEKIMKGKESGNIIFKKTAEAFFLFQRFDKKFLLKMIMLSLSFYACYILQYALLVSAFSGDLLLIKYMWAGSLLFFIKTFIPPVTYGDLGIREGISVYFITELGESAAAGLNASLFLFVINLLIPSLTGTILLLKPGHSADEP